MTRKYITVLIRQILSIFKNTNLQEDLTFPKFASDRNDFCESCHFCEKICPTSAIKLDFKGKKLQHFKLDLASCTRCQICIQVCPENLLVQTKQNLKCLDPEKDELVLESTSHI
jgi:formate hydrogenlyase subunit 6/NADH:ubiquinone oxidoreductase subunit I